MKRSRFAKVFAVISVAALLFTGCPTPTGPSDIDKPGTEQTGGNGNGGTDNGGSTTPAKKTYTVTFDSNGGSEVAPATVKEGEKVAKPADPTKTGYSFSGWLKGDDEYDFEAAVNAATTLKAKWTVVEYTITYDVGDGTNAESNPAKYTIESDDIVLANASGPEATPNFVAWHKDTVEGEKVLKIVKGSTGNIKLVAEYTDKATFTVTYYNGETKYGDENVIDGEKADGADGVVPEYDFGGWFSDAELTTAFDFTKPITADTKVYGKFTKVVKYTVTFDVDGGSAVAPATVRAGEKVTKPADPTKTGYTFKGWFSEKEFTTPFDFDTAITAEKSIYAKFEINTYTVTFKNGDTVVETKTVNYNETVTGSDKAVAPEGKEFDKWVNGTVEFDFRTKITEDIVLTAVWKDKAPEAPAEFPAAAEAVTLNEDVAYDTSNKFPADALKAAKVGAKIYFEIEEKADGDDSYAKVFFLNNWNPIKLGDICFVGTTDNVKGISTAEGEEGREYVEGAGSYYMVVTQDMLNNANGFYLMGNAKVKRCAIEYIGGKVESTGPETIFTLDFSGEELPANDYCNVSDEAFTFTANEGLSLSGAWKDFAISARNIPELTAVNKVEIEYKASADLSYPTGETSNDRLMVGIVNQDPDNGYAVTNLSWTAMHDNSDDGAPSTTYTTLKKDISWEVKYDGSGNYLPKVENFASVSAIHIYTTNVTAGTFYIKSIKFIKE